jgi:hypothetical protein
MQHAYRGRNAIPDGGPASRQRLPLRRRRSRPPTRTSSLKQKNATPAVCCGQEPCLIESVTTVLTHPASGITYLLHHTEATGGGGPGRFHQRHQAHGAVSEACRQAKRSQSSLRLVCLDKGDGRSPLYLSLSSLCSAEVWGLTNASSPLL